LQRGEFCKDEEFTVRSRIIRINAAPVRDQSGSIVASVGVCEDVTDQKIAQKEREEARQAEVAALERLRLKSEFLANMSHEIRTPIHGLLGTIDLLRAELPADHPVAHVHDDLERMSRSGEHLLAVVNDILDLSKIEAGKLTLERARFLVREEVDLVKDMLGHSMAVKDIKFHTKVTDPVAVPVLGDSHRLRQCLINLLSNALKFTDAAGSVHLIVSGKPDGKEYAVYQFSVRDTGIGMSADQVSRIFNAFEQADISTTRKYGGTGLGLSITDKLVRCMNAEADPPGRDPPREKSLQVSSVPGQGSTFSFSLRLPLAEMGRVTPSGSPEAATLRLPGKVLLAEDNETNRIIAVRQLQILRCEVLTALNGSEAVTQVEEHPDVEVVLMDLHMPVMDGYEATRRMRQLGYRGRIIAQTANVLHTLGTLHQQGFDDYLCKPFSLKGLREVLCRSHPPD